MVYIKTERTNNHNFNKIKSPGSQSIPKRSCFTAREVKFNDLLKDVINLGVWVTEGLYLYNTWQQAVHWDANRGDQHIKLKSRD
jgi:hypothetical protein